MCLPFEGYEKDSLIARGEHEGFQWEIVHNSIGYLCGYVRVLPGHPWFGKHYDEINADAHGGLTFAKFGKTCRTHKGKHKGKDEWWVGFDCGHWNDLPHPKYMEDPEVAKIMGIEVFFDGETGKEIVTRKGWRSDGATFKDEAYVQAECESLARQAFAAQALPA